MSSLNKLSVSVASILSHKGGQAKLMVLPSLGPCKEDQATQSHRYPWAASQMDPEIGTCPGTVCPLGLLQAGEQLVPSFPLQCIVADHI